MLFLWAINLVPVALIVAAWLCHYPRPVMLSKVRRALFECGLITCAVLGLLLLIAVPSLYAQSSGETEKHPQDSSTTADLPSVKVVFSEPKIDSPVQMPSTVMNGTPTCGPDGRSFIQFMTPPPYYYNKVVYSVSPDGKVIRYPVEQIVGLTNIYVRFMDPGVTNAVFLLHAQPAGASARSSEHYYMALFDYDGKLQNYTDLDLGFVPAEIVQLYDNGFLVLGADTRGRTMFVLIDSSGSIRRDLRETPLMPSDEDLTAMLNSMNFVGMNPNDLPLPLKIPAVLSMFRPVHSNGGVLIVEPGAGARVIEILRSGDTRMVKLKLPPHQIAHSIMTNNKGSWFVMTHLQDSDTQWNLFQVDPETGQTLKRVDTSGVPATSIACTTDTGFYGFRWIDKQAYLIHGDLQ